MNKSFELEERTAKFGENIVRLCNNFKHNPNDKVLLNQLIRSGTSVGANYMEANSASSKKDFRNKIYISKKEAQETKYWLRMLSISIPEKKEELRLLWKECNELVLIFGKIISTLNKSNLNQNSKIINKN